MAHTNISAISRRCDSDFATVVLIWAARARTVDVSLSGQGGLLMCVCVCVCVCVRACLSVCAAVLAQALFHINCHTYRICTLTSFLSFVTVHCFWQTVIYHISNLK